MSETIEKLPIFEVDKEGLAKLLEHKGRSFALFELLQNSWDEDVSRVEVTFTPPQDGVSRLRVEDDDPEGFVDLAHAYTLFAESVKGSDPTKRGRFNIGEKMTIAVCDAVVIETTTGTVVIDGKTRTVYPEKRREHGSVFDGLIRITAEEYKRTCAEVKKLLPPQGITTLFNGEPLEVRRPERSTKGKLPTVRTDEGGSLKLTHRVAEVDILEPRVEETGTIYEMGIPVVETGDPWHVDVGQKIPLNSDRDNVTPAYLREIRTLVMNNMADLVDDEIAKSPMAQSALADPDASPQLVESIITARFGDKRVIYDPTDPEANKIAVAQGYTVIPGGAFSKSQWGNVKQNEKTLPAGQVTPSPKAYEGAEGRIEVDDFDLSPEMRAVELYLKHLARELMDVELEVTFSKVHKTTTAAAYQRRNADTGRIDLNIVRLGKKWFVAGAHQVNEIAIHEFGHHYSSDHLSEEYAHALCDLGASLAGLAAQDPSILEEERWMEQATRLVPAASKRA